MTTRYAKVSKQVYRPLSVALDTANDDATAKVHHARMSSRAAQHIACSKTRVDQHVLVLQLVSYTILRNLFLSVWVGNFHQTTLSMASCPGGIAVMLSNAHARWHLYGLY